MAKPKKTYVNQVASKTDLRKKANRDERKQIKQYLRDGNVEGLANTKKFLSNDLQWDE